MATRKSTIRIYGGQTCSYLYVSKNDLNDAQQQAFSQIGVCPTWDTNTQFRIAFDEGLISGNANTGDGPPTVWEISKQKNGSAELERAGFVNGGEHSFMDYAVCNGAEYRYYIYPSSEYTIGAPIMTDTIKTDFEAWTLFVAEETEHDNMFTVSDIYYFDLNFEDVSLQNNTGVQQITTFSQYQRIRRDNVNCLSGSLVSLVGHIDCNTGRYEQTNDMSDAFFKLSTDTRDKFLRDIEGRFMQIEVSSQITMRQLLTASGVCNTKTLQWTEVESAKNKMVIGE